MKKIALISVALVFILQGISAQENNKTQSKPPKLSKLQIEVIQSDGYAYAEALCGYDLSKMKLAKDKENKSLQSETENSKLILYEVMERAAEKYTESSLYEIYNKAKSEGQLKLNTCIRVSKLKAQNELEKN